MPDRDPVVQVVIGRCSACGASVESADLSGLEGLTCARGHLPVFYEAESAYYERESETWDEGGEQEPTE